MGVIYKHPSMDLTNFNTCNYLNKLLENICKEQKSIFFLDHNQTNAFFDFLVSNSFIYLLIIHPTRTPIHSNTLRQCQIDFLFRFNWKKIQRAMC